MGEVERIKCFVNAFRDYLEDTPLSENMVKKHVANLNEMLKHWMKMLQGTAKQKGRRAKALHVLKNHVPADENGKLYVEALHRKERESSPICFLVSREVIEFLHNMLQSDDEEKRFVGFVYYETRRQFKDGRVRPPLDPPKGMDEVVPGYFGDNSRLYAFDHGGAFVGTLVHAWKMVQQERANLVRCGLWTNDQGEFHKPVTNMQCKKKKRKRVTYVATQDQEDHTEPCHKLLKNIITEKGVKAWVAKLSRG